MARRSARQRILAFISAAAAARPPKRPGHRPTSLQPDNGSAVHTYGMGLVYVAWRTGRIRSFLSRLSLVYRRLLLRRIAGNGRSWQSLGAAKPNNNTEERSR